MPLYQNESLAQWEACRPRVRPRPQRPHARWLSTPIKCQGRSLLHSLYAWNQRWSSIQDVRPSYCRRHPYILWQPRSICGSLPGIKQLVASIRCQTWLPFRWSDIQHRSLAEGAHGLESTWDEVWPHEERIDCLDEWNIITQIVCRKRGRSENQIPANILRYTRCNK